MSQCQAILSGTQCSGEAVTCLTIGCQHEHMESNLICGSCLLLVRVQIGIHEFWCDPCEESRMPHQCEIHEVSEQRMTKISADNDYSVK